MAEAEPRIAAALSQRLGVPEMIGRLLSARGVGVEAAADFLEPTLRGLMPDPSCLRDMDAAAERLADAVAAGEPVAVFGDYDVDGACAGALMAVFLGGLGCPVINYVPDRLTEGYGPNAPAMRSLAGRARLIVCVDCGTAAEEALAAVAGRADVVVLDHHAVDHWPGSALAVVNPNRADDGSGLGLLCATGVAFFAAVACVRVLRRRGAFAAGGAPDLMSLLDLVALATVCDMMPLQGVNRALVIQGLKVMARGARPGIAALLDVAKASGAPSAMTCGFMLGPRINAAGRISQADLGLQLLLCADALEARGMAGALDAVNRQRQQVEAGILERALEMAQAQVDAGHAALVIGAPQWHPGVVGIVAGRVTERFNRPACVAAIADGVARGSGRSVAGLDLGAAIGAARAQGLLTTGGGHAMACGFSLPEHGLGRLHAFLDAQLAGAHALPSAPDLSLDAAVSVAGATAELAEQVDRLAPFGQGNAEPVFLLARARVAHAERVGQNNATIRAQLTDEAGGRVKAMLFRAADTALGQAVLARDGAPLRIAGHLRADRWNGRTTACFYVLDAARMEGGA
jgi:single-stranded-DNA-specific exonuclease